MTPRPENRYDALGNWSNSMTKDNCAKGRRSGLMTSSVGWGRVLLRATNSLIATLKEDFYQEFNLDLGTTVSPIEERNNSRGRYSDDIEDSDKLSSSDESSETSYSDESDYDTEGSGVEDSTDTIKSGRRCCLYCACCECFICFRMPGRLICDKFYYKVQRKIDGCPIACPTCIPRSVEEEWRFKGRYGARFAVCECCASPECVVGLKWLDTIFCPICALWEIVKGIDFGYRRFRIQAYIHRHHEAVKGFKTIWV